MNKYKVKFAFINSTVLAYFDSIEQGKQFCNLYQHEKFKPKGLNTFDLLMKMLKEHSIEHITEKN